MRAVFAGTPEFALPALAALREHHEVVGVLTQPDRPAGRGRRLTASAVKRAALAARLPLAQPERLRSDAARAELAAWRADVIVVVAYGLILPREILALPRFGCLNIHASLLPRWRGAAPIQRAILAGDAESGVSIMQMEAGLDTGPVLLQRRIAISPDHTAGSLHDALATLGAGALIEALDGLAARTLQAHPQAQAGVIYAAKIEKSEARIDWTRDAVDIERQVRAFNPWPVAETTLDGEPLRLLAARLAANVPTTGGEQTQTGSIIGVTDDMMIVRCGRGYLAVSQVQRPGRKPVSARDLSHSTPLAGRRLG